MSDTAFFILSKIGWTLSRPDSWIVLGLCLSFWLLIRGRLRRATFALGAVTTLALIIAVFPVGAWTMRPIEDRYPPTTPPADVDGIVILGGFEDFTALEYTGQFGTNAAAERITEGLALARRYPDAQVVLSGGSGDPRRPDFAGADIALHHAKALGFPADRFVVDRTSRNTHENAVNTLTLVDMNADETWLLVTSAFHMRRALSIFCAQGATLTPYPVDYSSGGATRWPTWSFAANLALLNQAVHTRIGEAVYEWTGRSSPHACKDA